MNKIKLDKKGLKRLGVAGILLALAVLILSSIVHFSLPFNFNLSGSGTLSLVSADVTNDSYQWYTESGEVALSLSSTPVNLSKPINASRAFILLSVRANSSSEDDPDFIGIHAEWSNPTTFNIKRHSNVGTGIVTVAWHLVEGNNILVQNGTKAYGFTGGASAQSYDISIDPVKVNNSAVFMNLGTCNVTGAGTSTNEIFWMGNLTVGYTENKTANLPTARYGLSCAEDSSTNKIYCFGGYTYSGSVYESTVSEYDPVADSMTTQSAVTPVGLAWHSCAEDSSTNKIYCFGGTNAGGSLSRIFEYNPATDTVTNMTATVPTARYGLSCAEDSSTNKIYCFGGIGSATYDQIFEYNPATDTVTNMTATLSTPRYYLSCAENSQTNNISCFGGHYASNTTAITQIAEYDPTLDVIGPKSNLPSGRWGLSCEEDSASNNIYCFAGVDATTYRTNIWRYNTSTNTVADTGYNVPSARAYHSCVEDSSTKKIYCFGGAGPVVDVSQVSVFSDEYSNSLHLYRGDSAICGGDVGYFVVQFNDNSTIQTGWLSNMIYQELASFNQVNTSNMWFYLSYTGSSPANGQDDLNVMARLINDTTYNISRVANGGYINGQWYAISTPGAVVQRGWTDLETVTSANETVQSVDTNRTIVINYQNSSATGTFFTNSLGTAIMINSTTLNVRSGGATTNETWQVIQLPPPESGETPPTVTLNSPVDSYNTSSSSITFNATSSDDIKVQNISIYGNWTGSWIANVTNSSPYNNTPTLFTINSIPEGRYVWNAYSCDNSSSCGFAGANRTFTVDLTYPQVNYTTGTETNGSIVARTYLFANVSLTETYFKNITYYLYNSTSIVNQTTYTSQVKQINWTGLPDSTYRFNVTVYDYSLNKNQTGTQTVETDTTPPTITSPSNATITYASALFRDFDASDSGAGVNTATWSVNDTSHFQINSTGGLRNLTSLTVGNYLLNVSVADNLGSVGYSMYLVQINKASLTGSLTSTKGFSYTYSATATTIDFSESNPGDSDVNYTIYRNGTFVGTGSEDLAVGTYGFVLNSTGGQNYSTTSSINSQILVVSKATPLGTITGTTPIANSTLTDVEGTESNAGDADVTYKLYRNATEVSNPDEGYLAVGTYGYVFNTTGGQNYSSSSSMDTFILSVTPPPPPSNISSFFGTGGFSFYGSGKISF